MQGGALVPKHKAAAGLCAAEGYMAACNRGAHDDFWDFCLRRGLETTQGFRGVVLGSAEITTPFPAYLSTSTCVSLPTVPHDGLSDLSISQIGSLLVKTSQFTAKDSTTHQVFRSRCRDRPGPTSLCLLFVFQPH